MADPFLEMLDQRQSSDAAFEARFGNRLFDFKLNAEKWLSGTKIEFQVWGLGRRQIRDREISPQEVIAEFIRIESDISRLRLRALVCPQTQLDPEPDETNEYVRKFPELGPVFPKWRITGDFGFHQDLLWRAAAELDLGRSDQAYADTLILMRLVKATESFPIVLSSLVGEAMDNSVGQLFWQGVVSKSWSETQLEGFRDFFVSIDTWDSFVHALRGERARTVTIFSADPDIFLGTAGTPPGPGWTRIRHALISLMGPGLASENAIAAATAAAEVIVCFNPATHRFDLNRAEQYLARRKGRMERLNPYRSVGAMTDVNLIDIAVSLAKRPPTAEIGEIVAALEIYRATRQDYPARLDALVPEYLPRVPTNVLTGEPPAYARLDAAHFRLSSGGWHEGAAGPEWIWHSAVATPSSMTSPR